MAKHIMLDLETMGNTPNAAIVAIGAVMIYPSSDESSKIEFYQKTDLHSSVKHGGKIDPGTVIWWLKQSEAARKEIINSTSTLLSALDSFEQWAFEGDDDVNQIFIWGNGSDFDNVILASAYRNAGYEVPWHFYNNRCFRTLKKLYPNITPPPRTGTHHNALDDARHQAEHLRLIMAHHGDKLQ